jgi:two-component system sensor histidine kinase VicK
MTTGPVQLQFGAEFALFLAAAAAIGLVFLRADLVVETVAARLTLAAGAAALAVAAFLHGTTGLDDPADRSLIALRAAGIVLVALSSVRWSAPPSARALLWCGLLGLAAAEAATATEHFRAADVVRGVGAIALGAALLVAARRSISARIAASATAILFLVVAAVAVALSTVVANNVEDEAFTRYSAKAETEAQVVKDEGVTILFASNLIADVMASDPGLQQAMRTLDDTNAADSARIAARSRLEAALGGLVERIIGRISDPGPLLFVTVAADPAAAVRVDDKTRIALASTAVVEQALATRSAVQAPQIVNGRPLAIAASPVVTGAAQEMLGVVVATAPLDTTFLAVRTTQLANEQANAAMALVGRDGLLARSGRLPSQQVVVRLGEAAINGQDPATERTGGRFIVAQAVSQAGDVNPDELAVVLAIPSVAIDATREDLFRVLFVVAMGGALVAIVLAGFAGERIGVGLRRLTTAAQSIEAGDLDARAGVATGDELGALGATFDSMAASLRVMTDELRTTAGRLETIVEGMGEALVAVDASGRITDFNAAAEELCDLPEPEALGQPVATVIRLVDDEGADMTTRLVRPVLEGWSGTGAVILRNGDEVPVAVTAAPLRGEDGAVTGAVFVLRDVRREREVERMKTEFLANISHELRTPLTPIKGFAGLLRSRPMSEERTKEFAEEILNGANRAERVVEQLVNFATLAAGRVNLNTEPVPVRTLIDDAVMRWRDRVDGKHQIVRRVARGLPPVLVDRHYLDQSLDELIDNAVKYSPAGGRIGVAATVAPDGAHAVALSVTDPGVGIPPDRVEAIFEDFAQADASATRRFGGLGLGLAFVRRIARAHEGDLACDSSPGKGSVFTMTLPIADDVPVKQARR